MQERDEFHRVVQELARLLKQLPPGKRWTVRQEILGSLNRIVQLLASLESEKAALERMIAVLEAEAILADKDGDE
jgi:hypothetical protein